MDKPETVEFVVYGKPGHYQRQRHTKSGFNYQPPEYRQAKNLIRDAAVRAMGDREALLENERRVMTFHLGKDAIAGLKAIMETLNKA